MSEIPGDSEQQGKVIFIFILTDSSVNDNNQARRHTLTSCWCNNINKFASEQRWKAVEFLFAVPLRQVHFFRLVFISKLNLQYCDYHIPVIQGESSFIASF